jgi:ABC-type uncharacterized transport system auxiliary subunit
VIGVDYRTQVPSSQDLLAYLKDRVFVELSRLSHIFLYNHARWSRCIVDDLSDSLCRTFLDEEMERAVIFTILEAFVRSI